MAVQSSALKARLEQKAVNSYHSRFVCSTISHGSTELRCSALPESQGAGQVQRRVYEARVAQVG